MKRENGFYWCKTTNEKWIVCYWMGLGWEAPFTLHVFQDDEFLKIDERQIVYGDKRIKEN